MSNEVSYNEDHQRYEILVDGELAGYTVARPGRGDTVVMPHTEIDDAFQGQHLGDALVAGALDDLRAKGKRIDARCPFVVKFLEKHAEYDDLRA